MCILFHSQVLGTWPHATKDIATHSSRGYHGGFRLPCTSVSRHYRRERIGGPFLRVVWIVGSNLLARSETEITAVSAVQSKTLLLTRLYTPARDRRSAYGAEWRQKKAVLAKTCVFGLCKKWCVIRILMYTFLSTADGSPKPMCCNSYGGEEIKFDIGLKLHFNRHYAVRIILGIRKQAAWPPSAADTVCLRPCACKNPTNS